LPSNFIYIYSFACPDACSGRLLQFDLSSGPLLYLHKFTSEYIPHQLSLDGYSWAHNFGNL
jgi:hypothetical protein